jgi:hypothetical protein
VLNELLRACVASAEFNVLERSVADILHIYTVDPTLPLDF